MLVKILFVILSLQLQAVYPLPLNAELTLVNVVFRHGERTTCNFYSKDPYKNETFSPYGLCALTNNGKYMMYKLGSLLKSLYGNYLKNDHYIQEKVYARSTSTERTLMSASLVLAGLFPPSKDMQWHPSLMWQPNPVFTKPFSEEDVLDVAYCEKRNYILSNLHKNITIYNRYIKPYKSLFSYIQKHTGERIENLYDLLAIYFVLNSESHHGLELPHWTKNVFPNPMTDIVSQVYGYLNAVPLAKQINSGFLHQQILTNIESKINNSIQPEKLKMFLYSAHESTLAHLLYGLNIFSPAHIPPYGSAIIVELYRYQQENFIQIKYVKNPVTGKMHHLTIPGCESFCSYQKFIKLTSELLPPKPFKEFCKLGGNSRIQ